MDVYSEGGNEKWKGSLSRISAFVDPQTQSASVFIELKKSREYPLYEGQYLRAIFNGRTIESVMEIPRNAVFNSNEVYVVRDNQLYKETINIHKMGEETLVFSGLEEGSLVVVEPLINIPERTQVTILGN